MKNYFEKLRSKKMAKEDYLLLLLAAVFLIMCFAKPDRFLTASNFDTMGRQFAELGIFAFGMMIVIITGGMDLSIISVSALSGIMGALVLNKYHSPDNTPAQTVLIIILAIMAILLTSMACGIFNGFFVAVIGVHPVLATLGTQTVFGGISLAVTRGAAISGFPEEYMWFGNGSILKIPVPTLMFIGVAAICYICYERTRWGRSVYMVGNNIKATHYSGIRTVWVNMRVYIYSASMAGCAAVLMTSRYNSAKMDYGSSYLLQCIAVAVLGGTDILGGYGKVKGTVIAIVIMQFLNTGFNLLGVDRFVVNMITGVVLISVLLFNVLMQRRGMKVKLSEK